MPTSKTVLPNVEGSLTVYKWPHVLHLCLDRPTLLTGTEVFEEGLKIDGVHYSFSGLIHRRRGGLWEVSVRRLRGKCQPGWYCIKKNSKGRHCSEEDILSDVVMVQLSMVRSSSVMADNISYGREEGTTHDATQVIASTFKLYL